MAKYEESSLHTYKNQLQLHIYRSDCNCFTVYGKVFSQKIQKNAFIFIVFLHISIAFLLGVFSLSLVLPLLLLFFLFLLFIFCLCFLFMSYF